MDTACNFVLSSTFNALHDITWSFQYSLCGSPDSSGGFVTFLYDSTVPTLSGGGVRSGLCYGPYVEPLTSTAQPGLSGALIGVGFDSTGLFACRQYGFNTGTTNVTPNTITARVGSDFVYQDSVSSTFDILENSEMFRTLRFNLTDLGQTLNVHQLNTSTGKYDLINTFDTGMVFVEDKACKIGVSFATPISGSSKAALKIKDLHCHGQLL
jgi:hypothetical protein